MLIGILGNPWCQKAARRSFSLGAHVQIAVLRPTPTLESLGITLAVQVWRLSASLWLVVLFSIFTAGSVSAHTTGISYADVEIGEREVKVRLRLNVRELQFAAQLDKNQDLQITPEEVESG